MSRILLVGDLHVKTFLLPFVDRAIEDTNPDRVIVLGDYLDDWGVSPAENFKALEKTINWAGRRGNTTLLVGNHDLAYLTRSGVCPGNAPSIQGQVHGLLVQHGSCISAAEASENWLFTHAGLCSAWARQFIGEPQSAQEAADKIDALLVKTEGCLYLETVGRGRGGWQNPSPLWADWYELLRDYYPGFNQVVGHSPLSTCTREPAESGEILWCCDTFSTSSRGYRIGDGSVLLLNTNTDEATIIELGDTASLDAAYNEYLM